MSQRDEFVRSGYCRIPGFLSPTEAAGWLRRVDDSRDAFRAVGGKAGLALPFHLMDGAEAMARLGDVCTHLQPRMHEAAESAATTRLEPIGDRRRALRIQRYRGSTDGFRWHFDGSQFKRLPTDRGELIGPPEPLRDLRDWLKARPEFEVVQIFAFPVKKGGD